MNAMTIRILKEVRFILWTWLAVVILALLPLFTSTSSPILEFADRIGFLIGIPLLAVIPIGIELEEGTMSLLLSQPVTRLQIWLQKFAISAVAVITACLVFALVWRTTIFTQVTVAALLWALNAVCSGPYCALIARSIRGGLALNIISFALVFIFSQTFVRSGAELLLGLWPLLMLVLGIRRMARFEFNSGHVGGDLLTVGPRLPLVRIQNTGAVTNFIRKEVGLLRPLWLITLSFLVLFTVIGLWHRPDRYALSSNFLFAAVYQALSILLAGSLSVGEEKLSGMHPWHLILPMSAFRQWLLKLVLAVSASLLCAAAIPALLTVILQLDTPSFTSIFLYAVGVAILTIAVFWSACFINGTVRAILLSVVVMFVLTFATSIGTTFRFSVAHLVKVAIGTPMFGLYFPLAFPAVFLPTFAVALMQSYRMFRVQPPQTAGAFLRRLLPLAATAFVFSVLSSFLIPGQR